MGTHLRQLTNIALIAMTMLFVQPVHGQLINKNAVLTPGVAVPLSSLFSPQLTSEISSWTVDFALECGLPRPPITILGDVPSSCPQNREAQYVFIIGSDVYWEWVGTGPGGGNWSPFEGGAIKVDAGYTGSTITLPHVVLQAQILTGQTCMFYPCFYRSNEYNGSLTFKVATCEQIVNRDHIHTLTDGNRMNIVFRPDIAFSVTDAANMCGVDHFNWKSIITKATIPKLNPNGTQSGPVPFTEQSCNDYQVGGFFDCDDLKDRSGLFPFYPTPDPPLNGGYAYSGFLSDEAPWYWDEDPTIQAAYSWRSWMIAPENSFRFFDMPVGPRGVRYEFITTLVGIGPGGVREFPDTLVRWAYDGADPARVFIFSNVDPTTPNVGTSAFLGFVEPSALTDDEYLALFDRPRTVPDAIAATTALQAYVAYYGRPADPAGLDYWVSRIDAEGGSLTSIIGAFGNSNEFNSRYGGLTYTQLVTKIYQQTLGRDPDPAGLAYYVGELQAGRRTLQSITLDVLNGATTAPDSTVVANKMDVAAYYTTKVVAGCPYGTEQAGVNSLSGVTAISATVIAAKTAIDTRCGP